jgi:RNA polymerase sigma factor (sigma-70 family)
MGSDDAAQVAVAGIADRRRLVALSYRMLGTVSDAEDAVQETYLRWYRLPPAERAAIDNPQGWLIRVAGRVCLDLLGSARARRERYVGPWLPEPVPADLFAGTGLAGGESVTAPGSPEDPLDRVILDDAVSMALLVVLDTMTPAERVTFVLHEVFAMPFPEIAEVVDRSPAAVRQLATSARRRVRDGRGEAAPRPEHDAVVRAFGAACRDGDLQGLMRLLDPSVTLRSDGGGVARAARNPVVGIDNVARLLFGLLAKNPETQVQERRTSDGLAFVATLGGALHSVTNLRVVDGLVTDVWLVLNPAKLTQWRVTNA